MGFDDLVQLLILAGVALAWLLGGGKSKKRPAPPPQRYQPRPRVVVRPQPQERPPADSMADEIYRILSGEVEQRERDEGIEVMREEAAPQRETVEEVHEVEAYSLETLEAAGEASHRRFREKYVAPMAAVDQPPERKRRPRLSTSPRTLREAVLWREILGPPKGFS